MSLQETWLKLTERIAHTETLGEIGATLAWDQQVNMPAKAAGARAKQSALLAKMSHEAFVSDEVGEWLTQLDGAELDNDRRRAVELLRIDYDRQTKVPIELVQERSIATAEAFGAWVQAKQGDDYATFAPHLERLRGLTLAACEAIRPGAHPYDTLLDDFDPGSTVQSLSAMFSRLRDGLSELLAETAQRPQLAPLEGSWDVALQRKVHDRVIGAMGYDLQAGRLDNAEHPFTIGLGKGDVRITTHLHADDPLFGLGGTIHEAGHALYEQGLPIERWAGTGLSRYCTLGIHESQSRFWENFIGRSAPFFRWFHGVAGDEGLDLPGPDALYRAANRVAPGPIRISADEVTYNLHIIVRFEIEIAFLEGRVSVNDLPALWNEKYQEYLGVQPRNNAEGLLQDVHWSQGMFGYFPSYTLGNICAASLGATMLDELPDLWERVERGEFEEPLAWLRKRIHEPGRKHSAAELMRRAVGERDMVADLLDHVWARQGALYGLSRG